MSLVFERLRSVLLEDPTGNVRLFFGAITVGYALFIPNTVGHFMYQLANEWINPWVWASAFMVNGISLMFGAITNRPSLTGFVLEGWLGLFTWGTMGLATALSQGVPGPTFFAAFIAIWIFVRYPRWK